MPEPLSSLKATILVSSTTGGLVAAAIGDGTWKVRLIRGIVGALFSFNLTPVASPLAERIFEHAGRMAGITVDLDSVSVTGGVGFLLGVVGMICAEAARDAAKRMRRRAPGLVDKAMGGKTHE